MVAQDTSSLQMTTISFQVTDKEVTHPSLFCLRVTYWKKTQLNDKQIETNASSLPLKNFLDLKRDWPS